MPDYPLRWRPLTQQKTKNFPNKFYFLFVTPEIIITLTNEGYHFSGKIIFK